LAGVTGDDIVEEHLFSDVLRVVGRVGHSGARHSPTLDKLRRHAWAVPREATPTRDIFNRLFAGSPPLQGLIEVSSLVALRGLLLESDRLTIVSRRQILYEERAGLLAPLDFDLPGSRRYIGATMRADWHPTALQSEFLAMLRNVAADD